MLTLKSCCNEYKITQVILSQLNDNGDMKWCRALFQEAYMVIKMDGVRQEAEKTAIIDKYKRGAPRKVALEFLPAIGEIAYAKEAK